jgi:hypothetical protein
MPLRRYFHFTPLIDIIIIVIFISFFIDIFIFHYCFIFISLFSLITPFYAIFIVSFRQLFDFIACFHYFYYDITLQITPLHFATQILTGCHFITPLRRFRFAPRFRFRHFIDYFHYMLRFSGVYAIIDSLTDFRHISLMLYLLTLLSRAMIRH